MQFTPNRRNVLQAATAGLATLSVGRLGKASALPPEVNLQFGLVTYLWGKDMTLPELLATCEAAGVGGVELRTEHKHAVEPTLNAHQRSEVRKRFADSPVELVGYGANCEFHSDDPSAVKANIEQAKGYIQLMHDCGGSGVKVKPNGFPKGLSRQQTIEQIGTSLNEVAEYGLGFGQKIRVEVHGKGTSELPVIRDIFEVADHENAFVCWNCNGEDLAGEGLEANFKMVQKRIGDTTHIREMNLEDYPYPELMKLLVDAKCEGWVLLEARTNPQDKVAALIEQRKIFERLIQAS
ncbi:sugar phosphate isomerase/epimerase family protein [Aureliella helgolandensis]|uniref:Xylose isomerase-like TIM barrel n=1 Tax=Aureliella helgolandensis TaxID=2527968 RepID=A0A518G0R9_9BACT|nr:TIM barrel protein [Aureliella helgolandensis]QDV22114.1 Xylose isomerase-like TIM barrel [Aureliella helgolandensis]